MRSTKKSIDAQWARRTSKDSMMKRVTDLIKAKVKLELEIKVLTTKKELLEKETNSNV